MQTASRVSEPCEVVSSHREEGKTTYRLRRLRRRREVDEAAGAVPNELVYSELLTAACKQRILGRCHVRVFPAGAEIPTPYDWAGVSGFFMTHRRTAGADGGERCEPLEAAPASLRQGPDPGLATVKLRGLDLFCGGGNFGRGLEDGGGIEMRWANDYDSRAVHTFMANAAAPESVAPFVGSVDDLQRLAMQGRFSRAVPAMGNVDFVSGGSPCSGFSRLTNDKTTAQQRKNQSLVAAFASFVDLYRPKYGLLENVPSIVQKRASRDQDVLSQLICAVVSLGYKTRFFLLDASVCGSPQRRSRVFLAFAAPGLRLPGKPPVTHAHLPDTRAHSLGRLPTGEPMAERRHLRALPGPPRVHGHDAQPAHAHLAHPHAPLGRQLRHRLVWLRPGPRPRRRRPDARRARRLRRPRRAAATRGRRRRVPDEPRRVHARQLGRLRAPRPAPPDGDHRHDAQPGRRQERARAALARGPRADHHGGAPRLGHPR